MTRGDFAAGFIQLGLYFIGQFKALLQEILKPLAKLLQLRTGKLGNGGFNVLDCAHNGNVAN